MPKKGFSESTNGRNGDLLENFATASFSDYTRNYEEQKQMKDACLMVANPVECRRDVPSSSQEQSTRGPKEVVQVPLSTQEATALCKLNAPVSSNKIFARGKNILAKIKQNDSCQLVNSRFHLNPLDEEGDVAVKSSTLNTKGPTSQPCVKHETTGEYYLTENQPTEPLIKIVGEENQARKDMSKNLASEVPVPFMPAGMQILSTKPIQHSRQICHTQMEVKIRKPAAENTKLCRLTNSQCFFNPSQNACVNDAAKEPSWRSQEKSQPNQHIAQSSNLNPRNRTLLLKVAFERSKGLKKGVLEKRSPHQRPIPLYPSDDIPNDTLRAAHENDDMKELLELASTSTKIKSRSSLMHENVSKMLKLSKLAELVEEGRVLVRSDVPHSSTHNFKDFPFVLTIHEALNSMSFEKPKTIQAYVWNAILAGHNVAFVSGARGGKTLGYLIPILNNLIDPNEYTDVPTGCSPLVVVICSSWEHAELVHSHCCHIMKKISDFRSAVFTDATERSLNVVLPYLINGVTLLAATAPALNFLLTKGKDVISFDRCCHLVFDDADVVLKDNAEATKKLFNFYQESVQRASMAGNNFIPRQIVACANHWTKGMEEISCKVLKNPSVFISSCMEAAIYGGMKLDVRRGTSEEMDHQLLEIVRSKICSRTIIFCRDSDEVFRVEEMLSTIGVTPLLAHNQSIVSDFDCTTQRWDRSGSSILICTDDVLERLNIKNAQTLIHYFIPHHSKYDFSYRLSFAMDNFHLRASDADRPETHLLITKEFNNSLLTIVRLMQRFGLAVPNELQTEAILTFCSKEARKRNLPLCETLKAFGFCQSMKFCGLRHVILSSLDQPVVPQNGIVRILITAVRTATQYYARILKHRNEKEVIDMSGSHFEVCSQLRNHFRNESVKKNSVDGFKVDIGNIYARRTTDNLYERVRVESILEKDHQGIPNEVMVFYIDQGCVMSTFVKDLYEIPEDLRKMTPEAIEVFLVGVKPFDHNSSWSRYSIDYVREKLMRKELEGRIVLALSLTLWLNPLHERKRLEGVNSLVVVTDILKDLLTTELAENNEGHMAKLYHLCDIGGINLPNYIGLAEKKNSINPITAGYAFLEMNEEHDVEVVANDSPHQFYVRKRKFNTNLISLESEINKQISKCKNVSYEDAKVGRFCVVESPSDSGIWCRCCIMKIENDNNKFQVFFVDYGDRSTVPLNALKTLSTEFISRLPFQAIACSLYGIGPKNDSGGWTEKDICVFTSLTQGSDGFMHIWRAKTKFKETVVDEVTNGPHYHVTLLNPEETEIPSLADQMISKNSAISLENEEDFRSIVRSSVLTNEVMDGTCKPIQQLNDEEELKFDVSPGWFELFQKNNESKIQSLSNSHTINNNSSETILTSKKIPAFQQTIVRDQSLALIDHTLPLKESSSRFPLTKWAQNELDVIITFFIDHIEEYRLELTENHLSFVTDVKKGFRYELNTSTYGYIIPEKSYHSLVGCGVKVTLRKQEIGWWNRFIHSPLNQHWLTRDFGYWSVNDDSDDDKKLEPIVDPKYAFDVDQSETSSSDSDEECADEKWLRDED